MTGFEEGYVWGAKSLKRELIAQKYKALGESAIAELLSFPSLFAYENGLNADARVGFIQRVMKRSGEPPQSDIIKLKCLDLWGQP